ncbi:MAG: ABC transporter substrate-binding protein [Armatimonadota bacterium]|nr:ABC transporter substrate-binding protein [Armatimonadota bacterium]MDR7534464.1 ABC transporter substrate-binding protein [Armatimonadota bacterium]MDR7535738.1 ABC transporter substrate-binding protein [Armatimonadota bacterium]
MRSSARVAHAWWGLALQGALLLAVTATAAAGPGVLYRLRLPGALSAEQNLPALVADARGFFQEEGIELAEFVLGSGGTLRAAMIAREFDFGLFAFVHVPIARIAGSPWRAVTALHDREIFSLVVRSELRDSVRTVADLRGRRVGFSAPGAGAWAAASLYLKKSGLDPQRDVQFLPLGADAGVIYTALRTGRVDAFPTWEPTTTRVLEDGVAVPLVPIWEPAEHRKWFGEKALANVLVTREDVIARNPGLVRRVVAAHRKALAFIRARPSREVVEAVLATPRGAEQYKGVDPALILKMVERIKGGFGDGCLSRRGFQAEMDVAVEFQLVRQAITFEEFADARFAGTCP